jgi:hypothetical protein
MSMARAFSILVASMAWHPRPILVVDSKQDIYVAVRHALNRIGGWLPLLPIPQPAVVRRYLRDAIEGGRLPLMVIVLVEDDGDAALTLLEWIAAHPEPIRSLPVLAITDSVVNECQGTLDVWIESAIRPLIDAETRRSLSTVNGSRPQ